MRLTSSAVIARAFSIIAVAAATSAFPAGVSSQSAGATAKLIPHRVALESGASFDLNLPEGFGITVAAQGLRRPRFMAVSPDGRVFVTDLHSIGDNTKGVVHVLDGFDRTTGRFARATAYLTNLRNPHGLAFFMDSQGVQWLYLAMTDRLVRYRYVAGADAPAAPPDVIATFPDYGLGYKQGGWHLTRTIAFGSNGKLYVSVGSSCNACEETEGVRASVLEMDPDGKNTRVFASGLRNAVGVRWIGTQLLATNMGADHLGDHRPAETMYAVTEGANYGWPFCYQSGIVRVTDPKFNPGRTRLDCRTIPVAFAAFDAHSSPLGFDFFSESGPLENSYLVALHGSAKTTLRRGYRVVRLRSDRKPSDPPEDFLTGFLPAKGVNGRPVDVLKFGAGRFLLSDDYAGVIYNVYRR